MIKLRNYETCSDCGACINICSKNAIMRNVNKYGEVSPYIDNKNCIQCGICVSVCNSIHKQKESVYRKCHYIGYSLNRDFLENSSSGGIFSVLAEYVLSDNGVVYGAGFDAACLKVRHMRIESIAELDKIRKSKYTQSIIDSDIVKAVTKDLKQNRKVLFCGVPCQVAAIKELTLSNNENLILADVYCHGVVRDKLFTEYLKIMEQIHGSSIKRVDFRTDGQNNNFYLNILFENNKMFKEYCGENLFYMLFINSAGLKRNCFTCEFVNNHKSDITLGDFDNEDIKQEKGIFCKNASIITVNTEQGQSVLDKLRDNMKISKINDDEYIEKAYYLSHSSQHGSWGYNDDYYTEFKNFYEKYGFKKAITDIFYFEEYKVIKNIEQLIQPNSNIILYGAGKIGVRLLEIIKSAKPMWIERLKFAVTEKQRDAIQSIEIIDSKELLSEDRDNCIIVISVGKKYHDEIYKFLTKNKFNYILSFDYQE